MSERDAPRSEVDFYASRLLSVRTNVRVESSPELVEALFNKALDVAALRLSLHLQDVRLTHQTSKKP
jgi:hypothetical protein